MSTTAEKLNRLAELRAAGVAIRLTMEAAIDSVITPEQRKRIEDIRLEFQPQIDMASEAASELEAEVRADVLSTGASVKGERLSAVFVKGRVSWDTKALEGVLATLPEIGRFRREGEPSVTFRVIG